MFNVGENQLRNLWLVIIRPKNESISDIRIDHRINMYSS